MTVTRLTHITWYVTPRFYLQIMYFWKHFFNGEFNEIENYIFKNIKTYRASSTCQQTLQPKTRTEKLKSKEMVPMTESEL